MTTNAFAERSIAKLMRCNVPHTVIDRVERRKPIQHYSIPTVTDDEEIKVVTQAAVWMAVVGVTPLVLFFIINFLYPDLLWIPITPN